MKVSCPKYVLLIAFANSLLGCSTTFPIQNPDAAIAMAKKSCGLAGFKIVKWNANLNGEIWGLVAWIKEPDAHGLNGIYRLIDIPKGGPVPTGCGTGNYATI
ncbi:MAG TPA: hypothetical protein VFI23_06920 [Rhizomicrobium sp.]|nr:hypothetical protein [Rhizomicrobium sp.]